jgi:hypothetical protein
MNYRVVWPRRAVEALAWAYMAATEREQASAVTHAMAEVDRLLERSPLAVGESRIGNDRILFAPPIVVEYEVFEDENVVVVTEARYRG